MVATIHQLHPPTAEIGHFIRIGHTGHVQLETLHAAGRLPIERAVVDAAHLEDQRGLFDALRSSKVELVLDTKAAELSTLGGHQGKARLLPWANGEHHHAPNDFNDAYLRDFVTKIAACAVANDFHAVLAPTRPLEGPRDPWLEVDLKTREALRRALDSEGGEEVAIDYPLLATYESMRDEAVRSAFVRALKDAPFENLSLRISGFGAHATAVGVRRCINGVRDFHALGKPVIADGVGGLVGLALVAFGAIGGLSHGIAEKERFNASEWRRPRSGGGGGSARRIYLAGIDIYLSVEQTRELFAVRGAKAMLACNDPSCCPHGTKDTLGAPKNHFLNQRAQQISELRRVPELRRADHFLLRQLGQASLTARKVERLNLSDTTLAEKLRHRSRKLDEIVQVLEDLNETDGDVTRALAPKHRADPGRSWALGGRTQP